MELIQKIIQLFETNCLKCRNDSVDVSYDSIPPLWAWVYLSAGLLRHTVTMQELTCIDSTPAANNDAVVLCRKVRRSEHPSSAAPIAADVSSRAALLTETRKTCWFTYFSSCDEILVTAGPELEAHKADRGNEERTFEAVQGKFLTCIPARVFKTYERPGSKSLRDRFLRLEESPCEAI